MLTSGRFDTDERIFTRPLSRVLMTLRIGVGYRWANGNDDDVGKDGDDEAAM